jgi:HEAT repeat protein
MRPRYADLFRRMRSLDPDERDTAFDAVLFDRHQALPDLVEGYKKARRHPDLRFMLVQLMGFSGSPEAVPHVQDALQDKDPHVRAEACRALEDLRAEEAIDMLEARLSDVESVVRVAAAEALVTLRPGRKKVAAKREAR